MSDTDAGGKQSQSFRCNACGNLILAANEDSVDLMQAQHVLEEHEDEAPEGLLEECREILGGEDGE